MTYRDRREARAARLREWAEKRETKAAAAYGRVDAIAGMIPMGQPILVGHHSEGRARRDQDRIYNGMRTGYEHTKTAERMREKAENIERAADHAIYSDDPDAPERLRERIAGLEAERAAIKAYNKSCKSGPRDESLLTERQRAGLHMIARVASFQLGSKGEMPAYALSNLGGNINRLKKRLAGLQTEE